MKVQLRVQKVEDIVTHVEGNTATQVAYPYCYSVDISTLD